MAAKAVYPCFPNAARGQGTPLKTDPKRNLVLYALDRTVRPARAPRFATAVFGLSPVVPWSVSRGRHHRAEPAAHPPDAPRRW